MDTLSKDDVETRPEAIYTQPGDHDRFAHYYDKRRYSLVDCIVNGTPITTLCGKTLVPNRDPKRFPTCPECQAVVDYRSKD